MAEESKKKRKVSTYVVNSILGLLIAFFLVIQVQMMITRNKPENHGIAFAFDTAFLYVGTDSMEGENPDSFSKGSGIIIQKASPNSVKKGDVVTFYDERIGFPNTHRIHEEPTQDENGIYHFHTMGDNAKSESGTYISTGEYWTQECLIGKVVAHNQAFGTVLSIISPNASGMKNAVEGGFNTSWVFPVLILLPIAGIATMSIVDYLKEKKKQDKAEAEEIHAAMLAAGVDPNNEEEATYFEQKYRFKMEFREMLRKEKEKKKAKFEKELRKKKKKETQA